MLKKVSIFILCLAVWFVSFLFPLDYSYYQQIILPSFAPPTIFFPVAWTIGYFLIAYSIYKIVINFKFSDIPKSYKISLLVNYVFNQSFIFLFFGLKSNLLGFISCLGTFISCLFLYQETTNINTKSAFLLKYYIILSAFATILSLSIYLLNSPLY